jgi:hypothetical protein
VSSGGHIDPCLNETREEVVVTDPDGQMWAGQDPGVSYGSI